MVSCSSTTKVLVFTILSSMLTFAPSNQYSYADNDSIRGSLLLVHSSIAYFGLEKETHTVKLEIMTEYLLEDGDTFVKKGVPLGHLSIDDIEGEYFLQFSMLRISKDFTTIVFRGTSSSFHDGSSDSQRQLLPSIVDGDLVSISGRITYNEPINFKDESTTEKAIKKSFIQITFSEESRQQQQQQTKLISRESINGATSINIIPSPDETNGKAFLVQTANGDTFTVFTSDPETIRLLTDNYHDLNNMFVIGKLVIGNGGFNDPWSWHIDPEQVTMAEFAIELCDGTPGEVENNLPYWLFQVETFCPWSSTVIDILE